MSAYVIAVLNPKGGAGKSTIATNLARGLQLAGKRVIIADSDPQGTSRTWSSVPNEFEEMVPVIGVGNSTMEREIREVAGSFDFIVIDGAAKLDSSQMVPAIKVADLIVIPIQPSAADIWGAADLVDIIKARKEAIGKPEARFIISRQIIGSAIAGEIGEILDEQGIEVLSARTTQRVAYAEALALGGTVFEYSDREGKAREEMQSIITEIMRIANGKA